MKKVFGLIIVCILSFWSVKSLIGRGYFPMHDDTQVARVIAMGNALKYGQFPVRWVGDLGYGYGYPLYNFYGPLSYYFGGSLYALGVDSVTSTKWMFGVGSVLAAVSMFFFLYPMLGLLSAVTGSIIFLYAPYHAVQIFIRGSVGEYWAIAFVPLVLLGIYKKRPIIGALGLAGTILSHTILGFISTVILGFSIVIFMIRRRDWNMLNILLLGLGMSAFFWLPALMEMQYTSVSHMISSSSTSFSDHFICVSQLWNASWGYGGSAPGCVDGMSFKIGKFHSIIFALSLCILFFNRLVMRLKKINTIVMVVALYTAVMIFLMLPYSSFIWNFFPLTRFIQYPWRLLSFVIIGIGILSAYFVVSWKAPIVRLLTAGILITGTIIINAKLFVPQYQYLRDTEQFETKEELRFRISKISDEYLPKEINRPKNFNDIVHESISNTSSIQVKELSLKETLMRYEIIASKSQELEVNIAFFPGWKFFVNDHKVTPKIVSGIPSVTIPAGMSIIEARFTNTPVRTTANFITVITFITIIIFVIYGKKTKT
ncbi:MAG: hypothetical protein ACD_48C00222G0002 [uncultured bacterium]|nr:MAG: hypothetical protein ACD_48C00222G0002 [uncultured bacterium]